MSEDKRAENNGRPEIAQMKAGMNAMEMVKLLGELYRKGEAGFDDYAQMQRRFNAVKKLAENNTEAVIRLDDVDRLVREELKASRTESEKAADAYLEELVSADPYYADVEKACADIYGSKPVLHEEFLDMEQKPYTREQFDELKPFDLESLGSGVSEDEYVALVHLATADPGRCSGRYELGGVYYSVPVSEDLIFVNAASSGPSILGHDKMMLKDGSTVRGPRTASGHLFEELIEPARQDVKKALEAYGRGEKEALAKLIATGITSQMQNFDVSTAIDGKLDRNTLSRLKLVFKALPLLDRDPELKTTARFLGLKDDHMKQLRGLRSYVDIRIAGAEAEKRLTECGEGKRTLSPFEREQCAMAVLRKRAVTEEAEYSKYIFEHSEEVEKLDDWLENVMDNSPVRFDTGDQKKDNTLKNKYLTALVSGKKARLAEPPEIVSIMGEKGPGVLDGVTARNAQLYRELFTADGAELVNAVKKAADITIAHNGKQITDRASEKPLRTTAREVYAQLTEDYNKRRISYALYDARIQTMRALTKRNPDAIIDLATIDREIMDAPQRRAKSMEDALKALDAEAAQKNDLQTRMDNVLGIYSGEPRSDSRSIGVGYKQEEFDQLKKISIEGMVIGGKPVSQDEFAAISIITAMDPDIGGRFTEHHGKVRELDKEERSYRTSVNNHTHYTMDIDLGDGARRNTGPWILRVVPDARSKAETAIRAYCAEPPQKEMLASLIGQGVQAAASNLTFGGDDNIRNLSKEMLGDAMLTAKLLPVLDRDPDLMRLAMDKYGLKEKQIKELRGCVEAFGVQRTAELAQKKLREAAESGKALSRSEKEIYVEAILRDRLMAMECKEYSKAKIAANGPRLDELVAELSELQMKDDQMRHKGIFSSEEQQADVKRIARINEEIYDLQNGSGVGLAPLFSDLANKGPEILGQRLAERMPNKAALLDMSDKDLDKLFASGKDLINDQAYKEKKWVQDVEAKKALEAHQARQAKTEVKTKTM